MAAPAAAKQAKSPKKTAKKPASDHPSYDVMIVQALKSLNERKGSSRQAIVKHIRSNHNLQDKADVRIKLALKRMEKKGTLTHTTGSGASGSFLVADAKKPSKKTVKPKPKKVKKPAVAKKTTKSKSPKKAKSPAKSKSKSKAAAPPAEKKSKKPAKAKRASKKAAAPAKAGKGSPKVAKTSSKKGKKAAKK